MNGSQALDYARERYAFKDGDFARIRHQQQVIKAVLNKAASGGMLTNPGQLNAFLRATANAATVDSTMNIFDTAADLRHLRERKSHVLHQPHQGHRHGRRPERGLPGPGQGQGASSRRSATTSRCQAQPN